ncbi:MAG: methionine--tRNA ligase [Termitinemataceae bacterium]
MKKRLVTSALPYVNNVPHLGNLIQVLSADVFARFCRLYGYDTLYVCGTDEYGTATETKALEEGISPRELCDRYHALHRSIYQWFTIAFDKFGRTSTPIQTEIVQDIFKKLDAQGFIVERTIDQLHCDRCNRFLADRYVRGTCPYCGYTDARGDQCENCGKLLDPTELKESRCSTCGSQPQLKSTQHLYIDLPKIKGLLEAWISEASVKGFWANNAIQMTNAWIRDGLKERAITRDLKWGIPVPKPGYENKVFYVWFDAPIGYISITGNLAADKGEDWRAFVKAWWQNPQEVELFQFIGKDNIPFHTVIFPSSLLGTGERWTMLHHMSSTEYLNYESGKFSKSKGVGVFGSDAMESGIPADVWRFYIFYNRPEKADALFTWKDFQEKVNGELIGNLGNLVNRTLSFVTRYYDGVIPMGTWDETLWNTVRNLEESIKDKLERAELRDAFRQIFEISSLANKTFQDGEPWKTRKEDPEKAANLIYNLCYVVRDLAIMLHPYIPGSAEKLASFFGLTIGKDGLSWHDLATKSGLSKVTNLEVLFNKLEDELVSELRDRYSGSQKERSERESMEIKEEQVTMEQKLVESGAKLSEKFAKMVDLRVAKITSIERHPKADKLYIESIDVGGGETRTIVSGLVPYYREEELLGKHIVVVYNLKAAKLRGIESRGMLLAASAPLPDGTEAVEVLDASFAEPGTRIQIGNLDQDSTPLEIDIDTFFSMPIVAKDGGIFVDGEKLHSKGIPLATHKVTNGEVG